MKLISNLPKCWYVEILNTVYFRNMKKITTITLSFLLLAMTYGQKMTCKELIQYRDVTLLSILDAETAKAKQLQQQLAAAKAQIESQKKALEKAKSDSEVKMAITALKGAADQAVSILSGLKAAKGAVKIAVSVASVADAVNKGKSRVDMLLADNEKAALAMAIENEVIGAIPIVSNIYSLYGTIKDIKELNNVRNKLLSDIATANTNIDKVTAKMSSAMNGVKRVNDYQYYISDYLNKNCKVK